MNPEIPKAVKKDLLKVLKKAQREINKGNTKRLKNLSDLTIHNTSIFQDPDSLALAVIIYAISKLIERWGAESEHAEQARNLLGSAHFSLEEGKIDQYREKIKHLAEFTATVDKEFKVYVEKVLEKANIKKGSRLYEYGISAARSAELLGIGQWELMNYVGRTRIHDEELVTEVGQRLDLARSLFDAGFSKGGRQR